MVAWSNPGGSGRSCGRRTIQPGRHVKCLISSGRSEEPLRPAPGLEKALLKQFPNICSRAVTISRWQRLVSSDSDSIITFRLDYCSAVCAAHSRWNLTSSRTTWPGLSANVPTPAHCLCHSSGFQWGSGSRTRSYNLQGVQHTNDSLPQQHRHYASLMVVPRTNTELAQRTGFLRLQLSTCWSLIMLQHCCIWVVRWCNG